MPTCPSCGDDNPKLGGKCPRCAESFYIDEDALARASRDPYLGTQIADKHVVVDRISEGGMGAVYRAVQMPVEREVAVKVLRAELEEEPEVRDRFRREARAMSTLGHPNVITLYDFGFDTSDHPYMVMEFVPGESLDTWYRRQDVDLERILRVLKQILSALDEAHRREIVHRDLKPENIIVLRDGPEPDFVKLLDFGIARMLNQQSTTRLTKEGQVYGTPHYMPPEQATGQTDVGPSADVYAVGILLFEMLCGEVPFDADDPLVIMAKHRDEPLPELTPRDGVTVPEPLRRLMGKATAKAPEDRYASAAGMLEALEGLEEADASGILEAAEIQEQMEAEATGESETGMTTAGEPETATGTTPREESIREVEPDELTDEGDDRSPGLDWGGFEKHAPADRDRAGQRRGVYDGLVDYLRWFGLGLLRVGGVVCVLLAAFMVIGARVDTYANGSRVMMGLAPGLIALLTTLMGNHVWWMRQFSRDGSLFGGIGFIAAHVPDPTEVATGLADDPVWFLEVVDQFPGVEPVADWLAWGASGYASFLASLFA